MSALEPRERFISHPSVELVLGLYSISRRCRVAIERLAPNTTAADSTPLPEEFVSMMLGLLTTGDRIETLVQSVVSGPTASPPVDAESRGLGERSLWR